MIRTVSLGDGEVYLCKIRHVSAEESLLKQSESLETRMRRIAPIHTTCRTYFSYDGKVLGRLGANCKAVFDIEKYIPKVKKPSSR